MLLWIVATHFASRISFRSWYTVRDAGPAYPSTKLTVSYLFHTQIRDRGSNISSLCIYVCRLHSRGPYTSIHLANLPFDSGINALYQPQTKHRANYLHTRNTFVIIHTCISQHLVFSLKRKEKKLEINREKESSSALLRKRSFERKNFISKTASSSFPWKIQARITAKNNRVALKELVQVRIISTWFRRMVLEAEQTGRNRFSPRSVELYERVFFQGKQQFLTNPSALICTRERTCI